MTADCLLTPREKDESLLRYIREHAVAKLCNRMATGEITDPAERHRLATEIVGEYGRKVGRGTIAAVLGAPLNGALITATNIATGEIPYEPHVLCEIYPNSGTLFQKANEIWHRQLGGI